ncbi:MAG: TIM barrel protein [Candidatus Thermoplasmatota archaeon]|nr:TIM barrel protein [Candidatus Thermoplasmatota archaeon]
MIKFGVAGIPLSCKWRSLKEGVTFVKQLNLDAMEVRMFKDLGLEEEDLREVDETTRFHGVQLSAHAPSYIDFSEEERDTSIEKIINSGEAAKLLGADVLVTYGGFYSSDGSLNDAIDAFKEVNEYFLENGIALKIGIETTGRKDVVGSLEDVIQLCKKVKNTIPVLDFAHIHARTTGGLQTAEDFEKVFKAVAPLKVKEYYIHFSSVYFDESGERYHLPIKRDSPKFEHLAQVLLKHKYDARVICESPVLEHDAQYMKIILDRVKEKVYAKAER